MSLSHHKQSAYRTGTNYWLIYNSTTQGNLSGCLHNPISCHCRDNVLLFLDNKQVGSSRLTGLTSFTISTTTTTPPPLLLGGTDSDDNLGNFVGCLKNLAYNFE